MLASYALDGTQEKTPRGARPAVVIALHCSGASGVMWQPLRDELGRGARLLAPDLYGAPNGPAWPGERAFLLEDEAAPIVALIDDVLADDALASVHLVGHSYGAAVALQAALARPEKIASLTLFEPAAFHMLRAADGIEYVEITGLASDVEGMLAQGNTRGAMRRFVCYWGGAGAWEALTREAQAALMRWAPKATLDFRALLNRRAAAARYQDLDMPCRIITGDRSPEPVREIASLLCDLMPDAERVALPEMGHMAPLTHGNEVAALIAAHVGAVAWQTRFGMKDGPALIASAG